MKLQTAVKIDLSNELEVLVDIHGRIRLIDKAHNRTIIGLDQQESLRLMELILNLPFVDEP